jgi:thymidylate synthase
MIDMDGHLSLYMDRWSEGKFVDGVITGAVQQLTTVQARTKMFRDILRRSDQIAPVSVNQLRGGSSNRSIPVVNLGPDCFSAMSDSPCPWLNRTVPHH